GDSQMNSYEFDVMIIGSGIAGLSAAIKLGEGGLRVGIITREDDPKVSNTYWAQGGIIYLKENDELFIQDVLNASAGTSNLSAANLLLNSSGNILEDTLIKKAKTDFMRNEKGSLKFTREAAHSCERILYKGDFTGKEIQISLLNYIKDKKRFPNITILTSHTAIDLITPLHHGISIQQRYEENKVVGSYLLDQKNGKVKKALAHTTILATGGVGALYLHHSNSEGARGDGHAMAKRAGAVLADMEFIQFHPTTFYDQSSHRRFLISEALRGEGGNLVNSEGHSFMEKYHKDRELAPRDIVARAIVEETIVTEHGCVYLDISHRNSDWIKDRFPTIYNHCLKNKIDMTKEPIPVVPAAHYTCGGVKTDLVGKTNLKGLYAVGEVACTGLHGANRLASTSLLEGLSWGTYAANEILKNHTSSNVYPEDTIKDWLDGTAEVDSALIRQDWMMVKQTMWNYVGLNRTENRLNRAKAMFNELADEVYKFYKNATLQDSLIGLRNSVEVANMVLNASMRNRESVGCFYRKD
ncbi:MAG: L-aspartate oxidase, partial [Bdellovibrionota bacterium]|nr:L-aspartate oxidase [Bdellovibrionota bacterium]